MTQNAPELDESSAEQIAERLELTREALELTPSQFADEAGIGRSTYSNWVPKGNKTGERTRPGLPEAIKLCKRYHLTLDWIYLGRREALSYALMRKIEAVERAKRAPTQIVAVTSQRRR